MAERDKPPTSLHEFDYFGERAPRLVDRPVGPFSQDDDGDGDGPAAGGWAPRLLTLAVSAVFLVVAAWFVEGHLDAARYAFAPPTEALELGDVADLTPEQIPHNAYVRLHGITEHRGLRQEMFRGLGLHREDYWYFRLLGSRGIFIEVPADDKHYGTTTEVTVAGRAVDPSRAASYAALLTSYDDIFAVERRLTARFVQVGLRPGEQRTAYALTFGLLAVLTVLNVAVVLRTLRRR